MEAQPLPPVPPPKDLVSVWVSAQDFKRYRGWREAKASSILDERENRTINILVEVNSIREVYEHIDFCEFEIQR